MKVGDRVKVHEPEWADAAGRIHGPGKNHGKEGVVAKDTGYTAGDQRLWSIQLDGIDPLLPYSYWTNELRKVG